jgi:hypothetical protein
MGSYLPPKRSWHSIAPLFTGDRECLAAFLALESAEVLEGEKPANLINIPDWMRPCGKNFYRLWKEYGEEVLAGSAVRGLVLAERNDSVLLLLYREDLMKSLLEKKSVAALLARSGYGAAPDPAAALAVLRERMTGDGFPHEIGIFLGYPLKDVAGFIGWAKIPYTCQGPWKIYGAPEASLALARTFRGCRDRMAARLCFGPTGETLIGTPPASPLPAPPSGIL